MNTPQGPGPGRVVLIFTRFPVLSETFLQREVIGLGRAGLNIQLVSLWHGERSFMEMPVERNGMLSAMLGAVFFPYWLWRRPAVIFRLIGRLWRPRRSGLLNWLENLLGAGYALRAASRWEAAETTHFHAVWASAPAMAGLVLHELTGIRFSFAGHAYDLYENGGDGWISEKAGPAEFVRTSTQTGRERLERLGVPAGKILVVRRGLVDFPEFPSWKEPGRPLRILSVGRMVEKMGHARQIPLYRQLKEAGVNFTVEWIGDGPLRDTLQKQVGEAGLAGEVNFSGRLPFEAVAEACRRNHLFVFTGKVDRKGDRAGLPNALAEAMAYGLVVFSTRVGAVGEAIEHGLNGFLWEDEPEAGLLLETLADPGRMEACRARARQWVEANFSLGKNLGPLCAKFRV